jgi:hypothetical protein
MERALFDTRAFSGEDEGALLVELFGNYKP